MFSGGMCETNVRKNGGISDLRKPPFHMPASPGLFRDFYFRILERTTPVIAGISAMSSLVEIRA